MDCNEEDVYTLLIKMFDLALVIVTDEGYYRIADPIRDAAINASSFLTKDEHSKIAQYLLSYLRENGFDNKPKLDILRSLFKSSALSDRDIASNEIFHFANDLIKLTESCYHERRYPDAIKYGELAIFERKDSFTAREFLIRAHIKQENYDEAFHMINEFTAYAPLKEIKYLEGIYYRNKGDIFDALDSYKESLRLGKRGTSISRELAQCCLLINDLDQASAYIKAALENAGDNKYIIDIWANISSRKGDRASAEEALRLLKIFGDKMYYLHRVSRVAIDFNRIEDARAAAKEAYDTKPDYPPFEVLSTYAHCEIQLGNLENAEKILNQIDKLPGNRNRDIKVGLRCRIEIKKGKYSIALNQLERILDKKSVYYYDIKRQAIEGELKTSELSDDIRHKYEIELARLLAILEKARPGDLLPGDE